jgi:tellurite resistance-related uncharacterized protein
MPIKLPTFREIEKSIGDPAPAWRWIADITLPTMNKSSSPNKVTVNANQGVFTNRIEEIPMRYWGLDTDSRFYQGKRIDYPRYINLEQVQVSFYEKDDYSTFKSLVKWLNAVVSTDGVYSPRTYYTRDINIYAFDAKDNTTPKVHIVYEDAYPVGAPEQQFAYGNSDRVRWNVSFAINNIKLM